MELLDEQIGDVVDLVFQAELLAFVFLRTPNHLDHRRVPMMIVFANRLRLNVSALRGGVDLVRDGSDAEAALQRQLPALHQGEERDSSFHSFGFVSNGHGFGLGQSTQH
nr:hypothetical protein Iba_scaffold539756CG0010 [Ipomoea batatas]